MDLIEVLKALSHENRIRIVNLLAKRKLCVCELENLMSVNQSNASRHLNKLKQAGLIKSEQEAQWVFYSLNDDMLNRHPFIREIIDKEMDSVESCVEDNKRFVNYEKSDLCCEDLSCNRINLDNL